MNRPEASDIQRACGPICPWELLLFNTPNFQNVYVERLKDVGTYERGKSPYGAYDMGGNVLEWVQDWYGDSSYQNSPRENPLGPSSGHYKVFRGGSWNDFVPMNLRTAIRDWYKPKDGSLSLGFRCAQDAP